jgi:hypothetical protein
MTARPIPDEQHCKIGVRPLRSSIEAPAPRGAVGIQKYGGFPANC